LREGLIRYLAGRGLGERVRVERTICFGACARAPNLLVRSLDDEHRGPPIVRTAGQGGAVLIHGLAEGSLHRLASVLAPYLPPETGDRGDPGDAIDRSS
jgi:hypothetical protein